MRTIFYILSIFCFFVSTAQNSRKISLNWDKNPLIISDESKKIVPHFNATLFYYDDAEKSIRLFEKQKITREVNPLSLVLSNIQYENMNIMELGELDPSKISSEHNAKIENSYARNEIFAVFSLNPIVKTSSGFQKIISFEYSFEFSNSTLRSSETNATSAVSNSVLASGEWYRFAVEKSGVYKISRGFLESLGLNMSTTDPRNIKIYGHGGRMAPLLNSTPYEFDLTENAIQIIGEQDGVFDATDYILFYAEGVDNWNEESQTHLNLYEDLAYYYITTSNSTSKRIGNATQPSGASTMSFNTFNGYHFYETDLINIGRMGRKWFGDTFGIQNSKDYQFNIPNIVPGSTVELAIQTAGVSVSQINSIFTFQVNGQNVGSTSLPFVCSSSSCSAFSEIVFNGTFPGQTDISLRLNYNNNGIPSARGYLNYIILKTQENLRGNGKQYRFRNQQMGSNIGVGQFEISNASSVLEVWDITDKYNVSAYKNNGLQNFNFKVNMGEVREYLLIETDDFLTPISVPNPRVANQNLKGTIFNNTQGQFQDVDYLIVTAPGLENEAERLAQFHRNYSQLNVKVVTTDKIYHEFSSGKQDIAAIRNFIKYIYFNASNPNNRLKYINLFGHASFDYKNRVPNNTNIVPIFHALASASKLNSIMSDDFYGMMDPNEGLLNTNSSQSLDIAVGRMLLTNTTQARDMVNKVLDYHEETSFGRWRNNILLLSDDPDNSSDATIQASLDNLGQELTAQKPFYNIKKIHLDSYVQETSSGGNRYPKAKEDLLDALQQGVLVFNYFGHGNEDGLTGERVFGKEDAQNLSNQFRYPLVVTVTCEFARFDNPFRISGGELTYTNPKGAAISMVTTTRLITIGDGINVNASFASSLYGYESDESISIAEAMRQAKNNYNSATYMVFYLGDPALKLATPKLDVKLTSVNDIPMGQAIDTLKALSFMKFKGEVTTESGQLINNYNGRISVEVFDKIIQRSTLNNDVAQSGVVVMDFETLGATIFRGNATVENGLFEINFVVPQDIRIPVGNGKVSFYAQRNQPVLEDQTGANLDILVGGINENAAVDNLPPTVKLYMNDETFISGGITNESPIFLAYLEDENGINTASGIGHDIIAILDGDENNPYVLNDYYETELNDFTKGIVRFPFRNLSKGLHTIFFRAWDVYNNPVTAEIQFLVVGDEGITLTNVLNYPNPFVSYTQFWFTHNKPFEPLETQVQIFTVTGKVVKTINQIITTDGFLSRDITWDGRDDFGDKIGKGVYIYKLTVRSTLTNQRAEKYEKLVIL